jgi:hypothetical protein
MDILRLSFVSLYIQLAAVPHTMVNVFIGHFIEDAITCEHDEVMSLGYLEHLHLRISYHYSRVPIFVLQLGFGVSKCSRN